MTKRQKTTNQYNSVNASPVKSFFVTMLTRDISLSDAILDLLDNCVDGILRKKKNASGKHPYKGYYAEISYDSDSFHIHDNCGGIPLSLHEYAFRMGRPDNRPQTSRGMVGAYGIGMKRAIFKIGRECLISSRAGEDEYEVAITSEWLDDENEWWIPVKSTKSSLKEDGTTIVIGGLHDGITTRFGSDKEAFTSDFKDMVATHYAVIISKGFEVKINGSPVTPKPIEFVFSEKARGKKAIQPYIYKTKKDDVEVFLTVGFTRPISSQDESEGEMAGTRRSSKNSGWTVICNDRVVLYGDKTELTGWGEAGVPNFHSQFIAISGILEFRSDDARKLPTTTTKRGIDASSRIYLQAKQRMREGTKIFTDYTNWWKADLTRSKQQIESGNLLDFEEIKQRAQSGKSIKFSSARKGMGGFFHMPELPKPESKKDTQRRITYTREASEICVVGEYLLGDRDANPCVVGERCFEEILRKAGR